MQNSQVLDKVISVNWSQTDSFDLTTVVSCVFFAIHVYYYRYMLIITSIKDRSLHLLAPSLQGAMQESFSNGQSKTVVSEMMSFIRLHGLCDEHNLRLNVYVRTIPQVWVWVRVHMCVDMCIDVHMGELTGICIL